MSLRQAHVRRVLGYQGDPDRLQGADRLVEPTAAGPAIRVITLAPTLWGSAGSGSASGSCPRLQHVGTGHNLRLR